MDQYGVIGNPVQHSKSPLIHRLFAEQLKQDLVYEPILVPLDGLEEALNQVQAQGKQGVNITLPFKHRAFTLVGSMSDRAVRASAINTIKFNPDGSRYGDNTDGIGLIRDLTLNKQFSLRDKRVLILGAGGAVRGVLEPILQEHPSELIIANRTESKAVELSDEFADVGPIQACNLLALEGDSFDLIINGTSASLQSDMLDLPGGVLKEGAYCYDMVYGKGLTPFLCWAKESGAAFYSDGLGMLVEQAAESFYVWRNLKPDTRAVLSSLKPHSVEEFIK